MPDMINAFIEADRGVQPGLQCGVSVDIIPIQRLLHHEQIEIVESPQPFSVARGVGGVRIDGQLNVRKRSSHCRDKLDVLAGLDLQLDALVAAPQFFLHGLNQQLRVLADAQ